MATRYISTATNSPAGSNSNSGTIGSPWLTLAYACANASVGDTIQFRGGTYTEVGVIIDERDTVTIENYPSENVIIQNNGVTYAYIYVFRDSRGILFRKNPSGGSLTLRNSPTPVLPTAGSFTALGSAPAPGGKSNGLLWAQYTADAAGLGVTINSQPWLTVDGVTMTDARGKCIFGDKIAVIVRNCDLSHGSAGVMCYGGSGAVMNGLLVEDNYIHDMDKLWQDNRVVPAEGDDAGSMGVHVNMLHQSTTVPIVRRNTFENNSCFSSVYGRDGAGFEPFRSGGWDVYENEFVGNEIVIETGTAWDAPGTYLGLNGGKFHHNRIYGDVSGDTEGPGFLFRTGNGLQFYNNTIVMDGVNGGATPDWIVRFFSSVAASGNFGEPVTNTVCYNNIIVNGSGVSSPGNILIRIDQQGAAPVPTFTTLDYNLLYSPYGSSTTAIYYGGVGVLALSAAGLSTLRSSTVHGDNDIWGTNPLLNSDGTLQAGSPAIGAGLGGVDLGAFDYTGVTQNVTAGRITVTSAVYAPTFVLGAISVALARITQTAQLFTPVVAPTVTYVVDTYARSVVNGWGTADQGGAYTISGGAVSDFNVSGTIGTISASANRDARLLSVSALDITGTGRIAVNKIPTGTGGTYVDTTVRRIASPFTGYRLKVGFLVGGALVVGLGRNNASSTEIRIVNDQTPLAKTTFTANEWIRYRYVCRNLTSGVATLQLRVWAAGASEPAAWDIDTTDSTAGSLQSAGALTRFVYSDLTLSNNPVLVSFDDMLDFAPQTVQAVAPGIITQSPTAHAPTFVKGAVSISPARITQTATILAPSQIKQVVTIGKITQTASLSNVTLSVGAVAVSPGVITRTAVLNAPTLSIKVPVGLIAQTSQTFAPAVKLGVAVPLIASTTQVYAAIIGQYVAVPLVAGNTQVYSFGSSFAISIPFINHVGVVYGPILAQLTAPGLIVVTPALYQPGVGATNQISVALIAAEVSVHGPTIGVALTFTVDLISQTASLYAPDIYAALASPMELIDSTAQMFAPSFALVMPAFDLIAQSSVLYDPTFGYGVAVDLIALNSQLYQPELGAPGLSGRPPEIVTAVPNRPPTIVSAGVYTR